MMTVTQAQAHVSLAVGVPSENPLVLSALDEDLIQTLLRTPPRR